MSKIYGYCRISTMKQNINRQIDNIKRDYPNAIIITEEGITGTKMERPAWNKLVKKLSEGDTVVFDEVSRMSRNAEEGFKVYEDLYNRGINLVFIKEPHINTETYKKALETNVQLTGTNVDFILEGINKYLLALAKEQITIAFKTAQAEVDFLHQRTSEGVQKAIERYEAEEVAGIPHTKKRPGRPTGKCTTKKELDMRDKIIRLSKDFNGTNTDVEVMEITGLSRNTYYKYKKNIKNV